MLLQNHHGQGRVLFYMIFSTEIKYNDEGVLNEKDIKEANLAFAEKENSFWIRLYDAVPRWLPYSLDIPPTREEFDNLVREIICNIKDGSLHFVDRMSPYLREYQNGDIIAFEHEKKMWFARIVALASSINAIFAAPAGSAYSASKAAVAKAFESLALTYFGTNLRFSVVYPGPVDTAGLKTPKKLPFTWTAEKMGKCMVDFALSNNSYCEPSFFYKIVTRFLRVLPVKYTMRFLG